VVNFDRLRHPHIRPPPAEVRQQPDGIERETVVRRVANAEKRPSP
jgi:hypothetical protein